MITKFGCPCGADTPSDAKSYDGALGYEAIVCKKCGRYWDTSEHPPDFWSKTFVGLPLEIIDVKKELAAIIEKINSNSISAWEDNLELTKYVVILEDFNRNDLEHEKYNPELDFKYNGWFERLQKLAE